jgi:cell division protease FtsH
MSDSPNSTPPSNNSNRGPGDASGFNWRLLGLMCLATVILGVAYFNPITNRSVKELNYSQFKQAWDQGRIVVGNSKQPLEVITTDTSFDATINGWITPDAPAPKADAPTEDFRVLVNFALQGEQINAILGNNIQFQQVENASEKPLENDQLKTLSLAEFRKSKAMDLVKVDDAENPLRVLTSPGSDDAVIVGTRTIVEPIVQKNGADGKVEGAVQFSVPVSMAIQGDDLQKLINDPATYKRNKDYLSGMLTMFLPLLLIMGVLFFLFRQQMKSAGRGAMSFGKSKARLLTMDRNKVTFKDVAGIQEAKEELFEIVDFLRDRRPYGRLSRNRQDPPRPCDRRRGGCAVLLHLRIGLCGNVRRCRSIPRSRHVRARPQARALSDFHR